MAAGPTGAQNTLSTFGGMGGMSMNVYKQNSGQNSNIKDSISFSKMKAKIKKRQLNNMGGLQTSCNTNPNRGNTNNTQ